MGTWKAKETQARRAIEDRGFVVHDANVLFGTNCPNIDLVVFGKTKALTGAWPRREDFQYSQGPGTTAPTP